MERLPKIKLYLIKLTHTINFFRIKFYLFGQIPIFLRMGALQANLHFVKGRI